MRVLDSVDTFNKMVRERATFVVMATATWCGPCRVAKPKYAQLASDYPMVQCFVFDVDEKPQLAEELQVTAMPTFIVAVNGSIVKHQVGADMGAIRVALGSMHQGIASSSNNIIMDMEPMAFDGGVQYANI